LPEQIWDEPDRPNQHLFFGKPTGSATPLMWAHAEYIKLLRSVSEGRVFDLIPIVAERYQNPRREAALEVWKPNRRVRTAQAGATLRIQADAPFLLHWTADEWQTTHDTRSATTVLGIHWVDLPISASQRAAIRFTFFWPDGQRWEGRDYAVNIQHDDSEVSTSPTSSIADQGGSPASTKIAERSLAGV
jgi:glucoamylase